MPTTSPTMLALLGRAKQGDVYAFKAQDEGVREATIFALKDRGLIVFGDFKPGEGRRLVVTTLGIALLSRFADSSTSEEG
ncbi:hypothetical protein AB0L65_32965 [Nonomuraea sp. NPDC052116]|uniref:hypothetical protein n=1 Tax=Nonomuraea sp. NPDC052116 TaxID=3155665 RepID=UPI00342CE97F